MNLEEQFKEERQKYLDALSAPDVSREVKAMLTENYFRLKRNINGLSTNLYYDLLDKYMEVKLLNKQHVEEIKELRGGHISSADRDRYLKIIERLQTEFSKKSTYKAMKMLSDCIDMSNATPEAIKLIKSYNLKS